MPINIDRYSAILRKEISDILFKRLQDQKLGLVSITYIKMSKDATKAWVHFSVLGGDAERINAQKKLDGAAKFIKGEIGRVIRNITVPDLEFIFDDSVAKGVALSQRIDEIIREDKRRD